MNGEKNRKGGDIFENQAYTGVGQDKKPPRRFMVGSSEPLTADPTGETATEGRATATVPADNRPKHHGSETRQTEHIAGRVPPHIKAQILRLMALHNWTQSYAVNTLVQQGLAKSFGEQFAVMIRQTVADAVQKEMQQDRNRRAKLSVSTFYAAEQARILCIEVLRLVLDNIGDLPQLIARSQQQSRENLKLYDYSIDAEKGVANENVPWQ